MDRRSFLELVAGAAVVRLRSPQPSRGDRIVIAGGGIIGASLAYHLARRGAAVTLLEKAAPGSGATANSFAWINATFSKQPRAYFTLNRLGVAAWRTLADELGSELPVRWGGSVEWYADAGRAGELRDQIRRHQAWSYATRLIGSGELAALEPRVTFGAVEAAAHSEDEGHVDPVRAVEVLLERARRHGARIQPRSEVTGLDARGGRLRAVRTAAGEVEADVLVVACGTDTARVAAMAGVRVPLKDSPGVLVHTAPLPQALQRVVLAPVAHMKQKHDGRIVTGVGFGGTPTTDASRESGEAFLRAAAAVLPALGEAAVEKVTLGWRPLPADGFPVVGFPDGRRDLYLAVMHSGVTLSPLVGRLAAAEILDGVEVDVLQPYRPARFASPPSARP